MSSYIYTKICPMCNNPVTINVHTIEVAIQMLIKIIVGGICLMIPILGWLMFIYLLLDGFFSKCIIHATCPRCGRDISINLGK